MDVGMIAYMILNVLLAFAISADAAWLAGKRFLFWVILPLALLMCWPYTSLYPVFVYTVTLTGLWQLLHLHHKVSWKVLPVCFGLALGITAFGLWNFDQLQARHITVTTEKGTAGRVVFLSDLHYPTGLDDEELEDLLENLRQESPDAYILGGDIVDERTSAAQMEHIFQALGSLSDVAPVCYVYGNHDAKGSEENLTRALEQSGITVLEDDAITVDGITIVGRDDRKRDKNRAEISNLISPSEDEFIIVADHQPVQAEMVSAAGGDVLLSGHTHNGQLWPFGEFINFAPAYDMSVGSRYVGNMMQIVSSGVGGWGYPVRTAGANEYVVLDIVPEKKGA